MSVKVDIQSSNFCRINDESDQHKQLIPEDTISTVYSMFKIFYCFIIVFSDIRLPIKE